MFGCHQHHSQCQHLPWGKKLCTDFVSKYGDAAIAALVKLNYDYAKVCTNIGVCPKEEPDQEKAIDSLDDIFDCVQCFIVKGYLIEVIKPGVTKAQVNAALDAVCILIAYNEAQCRIFIGKYRYNITQYILGGQNLDKLCEALKVCDYSGAAKEPVPLPAGNRVEVGDGVSVECVLCEYIMDVITDILKKNATEKDIIDALDKVCSLLPSTLRKECDAFISKYVDTIVELILAVGPDGVCQALGVCQGVAVSVPVPLPAGNQVEVNAEVSAECILCEFIMKEVAGILKKNGTKKDIIDALEKVCSILPSDLKKDCDEFVSENINMLVDLILGLGPDGVCRGLGVCQGDKGVARPKESPTCFLCELVMTEVDKLLNEPKSKKEIEEVLELVCSLMPEAIRQECEDFVKEYAPQIIQLLLQFVTPQKVCDELKLCKQPAVLKLPMPHILGGPACGPCEMVIGEVQRVLKDASTEKELEDFLKTKVCSLLKGEAQAACIAFTDKYLPEIINVITSMTPEEVCGLLGLCGSDNTMKKMVYSAVNSTAECMICELIVKEIRTGLAQNATQAEIQKFLDMVCSKVPLSSFSKQCRGFVDDYTKPIIQYLLAEMDPDAICDLLKVCTPSVNKKTAVSKVKDNTLCLVCDVIFGMLETQLEKNKSLEEVTKLIENICTLLPSPLNDQCRAFLDIYGPVLLKLLVNSELSPNDVCKDLRLCSSTTFKDAKLKNSDMCAECKAVVTIIEDYVKSHSKEILDDIAKLCGLLPQADQQECKNIIEVYGSYVIDLILSEYLGPDTLCKDLGLCTNSTVIGRPSTKCSIGPMFWCASVDNAKLCNAVEHCRRHAWN